ncbi:Ig domain-containing protein [Streptomyces sp. NP160]|uniref:Ig domain-containing protein n=1 Tax=Streptomyces sp. NP160 TaxID=2586637 RepID=UPI00214B3843|nr:Ig domain-containing protein [Streptomyces sp. NP160]
MALAVLLPALVLSSAPTASAADPTVAELTIYADGSAIGEGSGGFRRGHAFLSVENLSGSALTVGRLSLDPGKTITLGTWGNKDEHLGLWYNLEAAVIFHKSNTYATTSIDTSLRQSQMATFNKTVLASDAYSKNLFRLNTCASFASRVWNSVAPRKLRVAQTAVPVLLARNLEALGGVAAASVGLPFDPAHVWYGNGTAAPTLSIEFNAPLVVTPLTVTTSSLPEAVRGTAYSSQLTSSGGLAPYTWRLTKGRLPSDLRLTSAGLITGRPTATGSFSLTVRVADGQGSASSAPLTLVVAAVGGPGYTTDVASPRAGGDVQLTSTRPCPAGAIAYGTLTSEPAGVLWMEGTSQLETTPDGSWTGGFRTDRAAGSVYRDTPVMEAFTATYRPECRSTSGDVVATYPPAVFSFHEGASVTVSYDAAATVMVIRPSEPCPAWADFVAAGVSTAGSDFTPVGTWMPVKNGAWSEITVDASKLRVPIDGVISVSCQLSTRPSRTFAYTGSDTSAWRSSF